MSIVKVAPRYEGENGTLSIASGSTQLYKYYAVEASSDAIGVEDVAVASDGTHIIPTIGQALGSTGLVCTEVRPERMGKTKYWLVTCTYGSNSGTGGGSTVWGVTISVDGVETQEETDQNATGTAIVNSAGDTFDPAVKKSLWDEEITISFSTTTPNTSAIDACRGHINSANISVTINGLARTWLAKCLKLERARYTTRVLPQFGTSAIQIWDVDYVLHYRAPYTGDGGTSHTGWVRQIEDKGFYAKDATTGKLFPIQDDHGNPKSKPSYLDGSGHKLAAGGTVKHVYAELPGEEPVSFASLFTGI